jgi:hypothetical protein
LRLSPLSVEDKMHRKHLRESHPRITSERGCVEDQPQPIRDERSPKEAEIFGQLLPALADRGRHRRAPATTFDYSAPILKAATTGRWSEAVLQSGMAKTRLSAATQSACIAWLMST